jgi:GntP family gluconate:H+ symporter
LCWIAGAVSFSIRAMFFLLAQTSTINTWPFVVLALSVVALIVMIGKFRMHPFLALVFAAMLAGLVSDRSVFSVMDKNGKTSELPRATGTVELVSKGLGDTARDIAISIALASIIGMALMESGAADRVVRGFLGFFGEKRAGWALMWSTYVLSVPIFFDTMFMLMAPLAKALRLRTGKDYILYVLAVSTGGVITHSLTVPHPGPLAMYETLKVDVGVSILAGLIGGLLPAVVGYFACEWFNKRMPVEMRETPGVSLEALRELSAKPASELPSFFWSISPVILPILLISMSSCFKVVADTAATGAGWAVALKGVFGADAAFISVRQAVDFIGHKNIALLVGAVISMVILARQRGFGMAKIESLLGPPLETAGMIILITAAGGAFGGMLRAVGVGDAVAQVASGYSINLVLLGWVVAFVVRIAQGSATVAMITASAILAPLLDSGGLDCHRLYVYLSIGWGAMACSWMNDSGFWVVSRLSGLTEREMLRSFTVLLTIISVTGMVITYVMSRLMPLV